MPYGKSYKLPGGKKRRTNSKQLKRRVVKPLTVTPGDGLLRYQSPSSYAQSLLDPFKYTDVRIPDLATHPSGTYTCTYDGQFTYSTTASATTGNLFFVALGPRPYISGVVPGTARSAGFDIGSTVAKNFTQSRLVSASCLVRFNGNDSTSVGNISCAVMTANDRLNSFPSFSSTDDQTCAISPLAVSPFVNNFWGSASAHINKVRQSYFGPVVDGCRMTYRPLDEDDFNYRPNYPQWAFASGADNITTKGVAANLASDTAENLLSSVANVPHFFVFCVQNASSNPSFNVSITLNYEGIPLDDTIGVPLAGVYCNPSSQAYGLNMAANTRQCTPATAYEISKVDKMVRGL